MQRGMQARGRYRFRLWRRWAPGGAALWIMLNPSTADDVGDDPTIRRCIGLSRGWGFGAIEVVNLYALRATRPRDLFAARAPVGRGNDAAIAASAAAAESIVVAWGMHGGRGARAGDVLALLARCPLWCLGRTRGGQPRHPLYAPASTRLVAW